MLLSENSFLSLTKNGFVSFALLEVLGNYNCIIHNNFFTRIAKNQFVVRIGVKWLLYFYLNQSDSFDLRQKKVDVLFRFSRSYERYK